MESFDLKAWLELHSVKVEQNGSEIVFTHANGRTSVLLLNEDLGNVLPTEPLPIAGFYDQYAGASIGSSHIMIATNVAGGIKVLDHNFILPDLQEMAAQVGELSVSADERIFMVEAGWMFAYTAANVEGRMVLREYDRDFNTNRIIKSIEEVFEAWWKMILEE